MANCVIFAGVNGAGKTTLYKIMTLSENLNLLTWNEKKGTDMKIGK